MKNHKGRHLKAKIITLIILQGFIFYFIIASIIYRINYNKEKQQILKTSSEITSVMPILDSNDTAMYEIYRDFILSRLDHMILDINEGRANTKSEFSEQAKGFGFSFAYLTDAEGNVINSYGDKGDFRLPFEGETTSGDAIIYGAKLPGDKYLTVGVSDNFLDVYDDTLSRYTQLLMIGVGSNTDICVISEEGEGLSDDIGDINGKKISSISDKKDLKRVVFENNVFLTYDGVMLEYDDGNSIFTCVSRVEILKDSLSYALQIAFFEIFAVIFLALFIYRCTYWKDIDLPELKHNIVFFSAVCLVVLLAVSWFWQTLHETTAKYILMEELLTNGASAQEEYTSEFDSIGRWLDGEYLKQCQIAGEYVEERKNELTRKSLKELADKLKIEHVYVMDKNGKVILTDSPYDHFTLPQDKESQFYEFRALLSGVDHVTQHLMADEISGETRQYVGVSIRDENDLTDGCVIISVTADNRNKLTGAINYDRTLPYSLIGSADEAHLIDPEQGQFFKSTNEKLVGTAIDDYDLSVSSFENENIFVTGQRESKKITGGKYLSTGLILAMSMYLPVQVRILWNTLFITLYAAIVIIAMSAMCIREFLNIKKETEANEAENPQEASQDGENSENAENGEIIEDERGFFTFSNLLRTNSKFLFEQRWNTETKENTETNELESTLKSAGVLGWVFCILFLLPLILEYLGINTFLGTTLYYIVKGNWKDGINLFSVTNCMLMIVVMVLVNKILNVLLYNIARISSYRVETICLLIKGSMKYVFAVILLFYILLEMGINPSTLLASAGILSVVIGFGAKDITADLLSGFFLIFEKAFNVGDYISIGGKSGVVSEIGIRTTKITNFADVTVINNSDIRGYINHSGEIHRVTVDVNIPHEINLLEFEEILSKELPEMQDKVEGLVRAPIYYGVTELTGNAVTIRFGLFTIGWMRARTRRAFLREFKMLLDSYNIRIPYDQIQLHNSEM